MTTAWGRHQRVDVYAWSRNSPWRSQGGVCLNPRPPSTGLPYLQPNILIKSDGRACIADFSLLTIISDQQTFLSTCVEGGTTPWMSPELLDPESFGLQKCRLTKESDLYALGMLIYEVLSGLVPFAPTKVPVLKILRGERPERPQGVQGAWFTDSIWGMLKLCWKRRPNDRPSLRAVLRCLQGDTQPSASGSGDIEAEGTDNQSDSTTASGSGTSSQFRIRFLPRPHHPCIMTDLSLRCRATTPKSSMSPRYSLTVSHGWVSF